jgi:hypothetical protein
MLNVLGALLFSNGLQNLNTSGEHAACSCGVPWGPPCCATDAVVTINSASTKPNFFDIVRLPPEAGSVLPILGAVKRRSIDARAAVVSAGG